MGNNQSALKERGYTLVNEQEKMMLVKNESGDQFVIKRFRDARVLDWIVMICMALKYLHDQKILHKNLQPKTFSEDLNQLVTDTLQIDPAKRPSVSEILMRPFIIKHLYEKSKQTIEELYETLDALRKLADDLERVHYNTTVGSLTGGVVGLAGGITSVVGAILAPFTLGASLIVTGVGIGVAVAGGVTAGVSNITNMVNQRANRQRIKMIITEFQEKITSTSCCIQNISAGVESLQREFSTSNGSFSNAQSGANSGARLGRGLGGISELVRLIEVANVGKVAAQAARAVRVAEAATGVLSALFVAVDVFFVILDSREIHNIRKARGLRERRQTREEELKSETMKFVKKIRETADELQTTLDTLQGPMQLKPQKEESGWFLFVLLVFLLYVWFIFTAH
ncbi:Apolipoprotein L3 [Anabarilius grahami]|uniref:Apolipoprotein L3 n=1 Tax=Anabarilius grahami TaxID=495550 RepID=A0A3N0XKD2_ANAGA|nr:Apolipoprotein L3 [Anabarilius grahami]